MQWLSTLNTERWTAVTASPGMAENAKQAYPKPLRANDRIVVGNWVDPKLLAGETFDTVLVDYFIGAIDGFAPYWQDLAFERLRPHVTGRMYITAVEPYVPVVEKDECGRYIGDVGRFRDAMLLLVGHRPYREYPSDWMARALKRAGFNPVEGRRFPIRYGERFIHSQLGMCRDRLHLVQDERLRAGLLSQIEALEAQGRALLERHNSIPYGFDYVIAAEPV
ncbi:class I SAM-dependent methyltransferase [Aliidiomarina indica]|uniref:class I SAM-dependent methyltransferase n=1 Tax=Aliidiomarina indica TaxID=2749147 RepID=UPI001E3B186E|nr:class I SAM-dependent methyltransferase [Aliidiomarina indica]